MFNLQNLVQYFRSDQFQMISNNPYNFPQKKPLSHSKILSQTNSSRNSSNYTSNRNNSQVMYNSGIYMNNSTFISSYDQTFFEPLKQPLSPQSKFIKAKQSQWTIPLTINTIQPSDSSYMSSHNLKSNISQKSIQELKSRVQVIEQKLEIQQRIHINLKQFQKHQRQHLFEKQVFRSKSVQNLRNDNGLPNWITQLINNKFDSDKQQIWKRINEISSQILSHKALQLQNFKETELLKRQNQQNQVLNQQSALKIKKIQRTLGQMGEDIHLVNDKEENLEQRIKKQLQVLALKIDDIKKTQNELLQSNKSATLKNIQSESANRKIEQFSCKLNRLEKQIQRESEKIKAIEIQIKAFGAIECKIHQIDSILNQSNRSHGSLKPCLNLKYKLEPNIVKYIQKMQIYSFNNYKKEEQIVLNEITYFLDNEGYLLDNDRNYLVSERGNQKIQLNENHLAILRNNNIFI